MSNNTPGRAIIIFVILVIILLLSSTCIGFYLYHLEQRMRKNTESLLDTSRADGMKLQTQLKDVQGQLALSVDKNKEADQKINTLLDERDLNEGLRTALKKENAEIKEQMAGLAKVKERLKNDLIEGGAKLSQVQELLKTSENKSKELEARLASVAQANKDLQGQINDLKTRMKPNPPAGGEEATIPGQTPKEKVELDKIVVNPQTGTKGHVLSVDTDAEFVVFNLGLKQGIKANDTLSIYRGDEYLGDIKATRVQDEMSAADIIPPLSSREVRKNDSVVLKP
jgi:hypothetical protein